MQKRRIQVVTVVEGSIIVDFYITANTTASQPTAATLFADIQALLESQTSPLCKDMEFGRFAQVASIEEVRWSDLEFEERQRALEFELKRANYGNEHLCVLEQDFRDNPTSCPRSKASDSRPGAIWFIVATAAFLSITGAAAPLSDTRRVSAVSL
jgi:hypothetical protein